MEEFAKTTTLREDLLSIDVVPALLLDEQDLCLGYQDLMEEMIELKGCITVGGDGELLKHLPNRGAKDGVTKLSKTGSTLERN